MVLPTFLGIGASRSGTTSLYAYLRDHPQVFVPPTKELHFFTFGQRGAAKVEALEGYRRHFEGAGPFAMRGEISPSYLWHPAAARAIRETLGDIRLLVLLRDPVERAISDYQYGRANGAINVDFPAFLRQGVAELRAGRVTALPFAPSAVLWKGLYSRQVRAYAELFPREAVGLWLFEDLRDQPERFARALCQFLGVEPVAGLVPGRTNQRGEAVPVGVEERRRLADLYRKDIAVTADLIGRDLSHWAPEGRGRKAGP